MPYKKIKMLCTLSIIAAIFVLPLHASGNFIQKNPGNNNENYPSERQAELLQKSLPSITSYHGNLRVYIVEPTSRWNDYSSRPYHFGFLDFAYNDKVSIPYGETYNTTLTWDPSTEGYSGITEGNIMAIAVLFNPEGTPAYADPPTGNKFTAYYVDACAGSIPGSQGHNVVTDVFTHTVFIEEATTTWCPYCPAMADALYSVYKSGSYPFYFVSLVRDKNTEANNRLQNDYNSYIVPSAFFDGGFKVLVGGYDDEKYYRSRIEYSGQRDVHDLYLSISVEWQQDNSIRIGLSIANNEEIENDPPETPVITGTTEGRIDTTYEYTFVSTDPDGDDIYYWVQWGEGCPSLEWIGPYRSGEEVTMNYSWTNKGDYTISVKAKDTHDAESDWGTLEVSMPKTQAKIFFSFLGTLIDNFREKFPFLHYLFTHLIL